jgi:hypothetical protein
VHSAGGGAVRAAERVGVFSRAAAFFRRSPRLLRRYTADDGTAGGKQLARTMDNVRGVIDRYGIKMNPGARIKVDLALRGVRGETKPNRLIRLGPRAFENEEQLARSVYHENIHVGQINAHGRFFKDVAEGDKWEKEAWGAERAWWQNHPLNPANQKGTP